MLKKIFEPISLRKINLKNRIVFPAITTLLATEKGIVTEEMVSFYRKRAEGDPGLIIVEPGIVSPEGNLGFRSMGIYKDEFIPGLATLAAAIKQAGAGPFIQLAHVGPKGHIKINGQVPQGPSAVEVFRGQIPKEMSIAEIEAVIEKFVAAAHRVCQAGFEGVELHAAHYYLLSTFISPFTNRRTDKYGGNVQGRCRIIREITKGIKAKNGEDFPVICRFNGAELSTPGISGTEAKEVARELEQSAGVDALHVSAHNIPCPEDKFYTMPGTCLPGPHDQQGIFVDLAGSIKEAVDIPVIAVGKIHQPAVAEKTVAEGKADLVAIGRQLVADPNTLKHWLQGSEPNTCLNCNGCFKSLVRGSIKCTVNPELY